MSRAPYLLVVGIDFGTSFTKVVVRDAHTGQAEVVRRDEQWLIPSIIGVDSQNLYGTYCAEVSCPIPYLKMLIGDVTRSGASFDFESVGISQTGVSQSRCLFHFWPGSSAV